jgi:hypothetical protein
LRPRESLRTSPENHPVTVPKTPSPKIKIMNLTSPDLNNLAVPEILPDLMQFGEDDGAINFLPQPPPPSVRALNYVDENTNLYRGFTFVNSKSKNNIFL